jgi:hypothetical protein
MGSADLSEFEKGIHQVYAGIVERRGRRALDGIAVNVRAGDDYAAEYVAKFGREPVAARRGGAAWELANAAGKTRGAEHGHYSPFQLLDLAGDDWAEKMFAEFGETIRGRRQLVWSNGLRELLGLGDEESDDSVAAEGEPESAHFVSFLESAWKVARLRPAEVLDAMGRMTFDEFRAWGRERGFDVESPLLTLASEAEGQYKRVDLVMG